MHQARSPKPEERMCGLVVDLWLVAVAACCMCEAVVVDAAVVVAVWWELSGGWRELWAHIPYTTFNAKRGRYYLYHHHH